MSGVVNYEKDISSLHEWQVSTPLPKPLQYTNQVLLNLQWGVMTGLTIASRCQVFSGQTDYE